ncbi:hypothetical protein MY8738_002450 [Beauveria namnaoensis]
MREILEKLFRKHGKGPKTRPGAATTQEVTPESKVLSAVAETAVVPADTLVSAAQPCNNHDSISDDLWADAYKLLRERDKDIVHEYEKTLGSTLDSVGESLSNPVSVRKLVERLREVHYGKQLIFRFRGEEHKYRDQFNNLVKLAIFADALVKQALATQPYAALAWTGVSILLPLLSSALAGEAALVKGLAAVGHVQLYWKSCEDTYLKPSIANNYDIILRQLPTVYSHILEYYFHAICYLAKDKKRRMLQVTTGWTSWSDKVGDIDKESDFCKTLLQPAQQTTLERVNEAKLQRLDSLFKATRDIAKVMSENRAEDIEMQICENLKRVAGNYETAKNSNLERVKGTCEWFFSDPDFCNWRDSMENGLFWVSADPGCGKSVLSRALIDDGHLKSTVSTFDMTSSVATVREEDNSVCYFFFKEDVQGRTMLVNAFSAILHELFAQDKTNQLIQHAAAHHRLNAKFLAEEFIPLWDILVACSSSISGGGVICVLDALDECEREDRDLLMEKLQDYYTASQGEQKLKFLITSRPYKTITRLFDRFSRRAKLLHLDGDDKHDEVSRDMDLVIDARLDDITEYFSQKDREKVRERLRSQGSKTYLWLHLAFSIIKDSPSKYSRSQDVETLLSSIPPEVSQAYEKILDRSEDEEKTIILLQLVLAAQTPLTLAEANYALTLAGAPTKPQRHDDLTARCYGADFRSTVKSFCGLIITIQDGCLHFIHLTAREFLMSDKPEAGSKWKGRFALGPGLHEEMSRCCISYLLLDDWIEIAPVAAASQDPDQENRFPLLNYASRNWGHHFGQLSEVMRTPIKKDARRLLDADGPYVKLWGARFRPYPSNPELNWGKHVFDGWTDLAIASLLGLRDMVEEMLVDEKVDFNTSHKNWSALSAAIHGGHESTAALLLSHGATVSHGANIRDLVRYAADVGAPDVFRTVVGNAIDWNTVQGIKEAVVDMAKRDGSGRPNHLRTLARAIKASEPLTQSILDTFMEYETKLVGYELLVQVVRRNQGGIIFRPQLLRGALRMLRSRRRLLGERDLTLFSQLLQNKETFGVSVTKQVLCSLAESHDTEVLALFLDHYTGPNMTADLLMRASTDIRPTRKFQLLLNYGGGNVHVDERLLWSAACAHGSEPLATLLKYQRDKTQVTPRVMQAAIRRQDGDAFEKMELILDLVGSLRANSQGFLASVVASGSRHVGDKNVLPLLTSSPPKSGQRFCHPRSRVLTERFLEYVGSDLIPSEDVLCCAVANDSAVLSFLLERFGKKISITSTVVMAAARSIKRTDAWYETTLAELLDKRNDEVVLTSELLRATSLYMEPIGWLEMFSKWKHEEIRRQAPLALLLAVETGTELAGLKLLADGELITPAMVTEEVFTAMVKNTSSGIDMLKYILAKYKHEVSIPQTLLEKLVGYNYGLKVDVLDYLMNQRPDDFRVTRDAMDAAARNGRGNVLEYLYTHSSHDGDVSGLETQWAVMAQLRSAARRGNLEDTKAAVERGADVNSRSMDGKTALHEAAYQGHADVVEFLLARPDVEVNTFDSYGRTPLHEAAQQGREKILKSLLARPDVDVNTFDIYGRTPLHDCRGYQNGKIARMLLLEAAADPNPADEEGRTPLHTAIYQDHLYLLRILIEAGADVDRADNRGITPRMLAEEWAEWNYWRHWKMIEGWEILRSSRIYEGSI